ncbi:MAG: hypothetical protein V3V48_04460, partial [Candidatus Aminicenantaceae bacterium]
PSSLVSATYLGGTKGDRGRGVRVSSDGSIIYMTGMTEARDFPLSPNAYLDTPKGGFVSVFAWQDFNDPPVVIITSPTEELFPSGTTIDFEGSASDTEDGDLTSSINWNSNINGDFGTGGSFSTSSLSDGTHTITASVTDTGGQIGSASIEITVGDPPQTETISVASITYSTTGGKSRDKHLNIAIALNPSISGAVVSLELYRDGSFEKSFSGSTDGQGVVIFTHKNAQSDSYTSEVIDVIAAGYEWDHVTPANSFTK